MQIEWQAAQIQGSRAYQEDAFAVVMDNAIHYQGRHYPLEPPAFPEHFSLYIMVDGMGGMGHGDLAAAFITESFVEQFTNQIMAGTDKSTALKSALNTANLTIRNHVKQAPARQGMGATLVAALVNTLEGTLEWVSVGDSLLGLFRNEQLQLLNVQHNWHWLAEQRRSRGEAVDEERIAQIGDALCAAVDGSELMFIDQPPDPIQLQPQDVIVIATDGLNSLPGVRRNNALASCAQSLASQDSASVAEALDGLFKGLAEVNHPQQDNCSIILLGFSA